MTPQQERELVELMRQLCELGLILRVALEMIILALLIGLVSGIAGFFLHVIMGA